MKPFHSDPTEFGPKISYGDGKEWARVVLDSVGPHGVRVVTVEARYWHAIHAQVMTHRAIAKSSASNRAIPFYREVRCPVCSVTPARDVCPECGDTGFITSPTCNYAAIDNNPFVPEFLHGEQPGMQSGEPLSPGDAYHAAKIIAEMRDYCLNKCLTLHELGLHKSLINYYLTPHAYATVLMTATEWANFFRLRIHPKAEKHFDKIARLIREAIRRSEPQQLRTGEWHTPYIRPEEVDSIRKLVTPPPWFDPRRDVMNLPLKMVSAARCARLSYLTHDGRRDYAADMALCEKLVDPKNDDGTDDDAQHCSPLEHVLRCEANPAHRSGPLLGWHQFRKDFPRENVAGIGPLG